MIGINLVGILNYVFPKFLQQTGLIFFWLLFLDILHSIPFDFKVNDKQCFLLN